jgi:transposase-like protein
MNATNDWIAVACADCPHCSKENVLARMASARGGFSATTEHNVTCRGCNKMFTVPEYRLEVRRRAREAVCAEYGTNLSWIE